MYASPIASERLLAGEPVGGAKEERLGVGEAALDGGDDQLALGAEQAEQIRLRDAGHARDHVGRGALVPALRKDGHRGFEDLLAAFGGGEAFGGGGWGHASVW